MCVRNKSVYIDMCTVNVYIYICAQSRCIHRCITVHIHTSIHLHMGYIYMYMGYLYIYTHRFMCIHAHICIKKIYCVCVWGVCMHTQKYGNTHAHIHTRRNMQIRTHVYMSYTEGPHSKTRQPLFAVLCMCVRCVHTHTHKHRS